VCKAPDRKAGLRKSGAAQKTRCTKCTQPQGYAEFRAMHKSYAAEHEIYAAQKSCPDMRR